MTEEHRTDDGGPLLRLEVGPVAHGGICVARHEGRVVFVRHALPGEVVLARTTQAGESDRFWRADAIEVVVASPDRVEPRCPVSGPAGCGGCDFQHVALPAQRALKASVVVEQLRRLAGLERPDLVVEAVPGDDDGLGWRTRARFTVDEDGRPGLRRHRSHDVVPVASCPITHPRVSELGVGRRRWLGSAAVEVVAPARGDDRLVVVEPTTPQGRAQVPPLGGATATARSGAHGLTRLSGRTWVSEEVVVDGEVRRFRVTGPGFWQVHPGAAQTLLDVVLAFADPRPGERAVDLYSGAGLFSAGLAARVGVTGAVLAVESDQRALADARRSLHEIGHLRLEHGRVERVLEALVGPGTDWPQVDVVVLDPPRAGAGKGVIARVAAARPRAVVLVACDPAALARDVAVAARHGYGLDALRAFDLFPMTHHVECVALLRPMAMD